MLGRQVCYPLKHSHSPFCFSYFSDSVLCFFSQAASDLNLDLYLATYTSHVAVITGHSIRSRLFVEMLSYFFPGLASYFCLVVSILFWILYKLCLLKVWHDQGCALGWSPEVEQARSLWDLVVSLTGQKMRRWNQKMLLRKWNLCYLSLSCLLTVYLHKDTQVQESHHLKPLPLATCNPSVSGCCSLWV
jgi:hypothetical protein